MSIQTSSRRRRRPKHQWSTTEGTRRSILDAARTVFGKYGFADANVSEVVELAGSSIGSLYHHCGGKSELFLALWDRYTENQRALVNTAVEQATAKGTTDPWALFLVACRALLDSAWETRDLVRIFYDGDTPTGFAKELADYRKTYLGAQLKALKPDNDALQRVIVLAFTSVIGEGRREIARCRSGADARGLADNLMRVLGEMKGLFSLR